MSDIPRMAGEPADDDKSRASTYVAVIVVEAVVVIGLWLFGLYFSA